MTAGSLADRVLSEPMPYRPFSPVVGDLVARVTVGALFTLLSLNLLGDFMRTGHVTGLLLLVGESLVVVLSAEPSAIRGPVTCGRPIDSSNP